MSWQLEEAGSTQDGERLNLRGLVCPLPVLLTRKHLARLRPGQILSVEVSDPRAPHDLAELCRTLNHRLLDERPLPDAVRLRILRGPD